MLAQKRKSTLHGDLIRAADFLAKTSTKQKDHINDMSQLRARDPSEVHAGGQSQETVLHAPHVSSKDSADTQRLGLQATFPTRYHPKPIPREAPALLQVMNCVT